MYVKFVPFLTINFYRTSFLWFCAKHRSRVRKTYPKLSATDVSKILGVMWRTATPENRAPFQKLADWDRIRYQADKEEYFRRQGPLTTQMKNFMGSDDIDITLPEDNSSILHKGFVISHFPCTENDLMTPIIDTEATSISTSEINFPTTNIENLNENLNNELISPDQQKTDVIQEKMISNIFSLSPGIDQTLPDKIFADDDTSDSYDNIPILSPYINLNIETVMDFPYSN